MSLTQAYSSNQEGRILLAIQAIKLYQFRSVRAAAIAYDVPPQTLRDRIKGTAPRCDTPSNTQRLTFQEEEAIVRYILNLDSRGFPPQLAAVQEMADLLAKRNVSPIGKNWTSNFITRRIEIKTKFGRKYDYKRALCEDLVIIRDWFKLVQNIVAKYRI